MPSSSGPYKRPPRKTRSESPAESTQELLDSLPPSLRPGKSSVKHSKNKQNNQVNQIVEEEDDMESAPGSDIGPKDKDDMDYAPGGDTDPNNEDKDEDDIDPGLAGYKSDEEEEEEEETQNSGPKSTLGDVHREPFQTSSCDHPSINLPMGQARRAEWEKIADLFDLDSTHRANALRISSITGSQNQFQAGVCLMQQVLQELDNGKQPSNSHDTATSTAWVPRSDFGTRIIAVMRLTLKDHTIEAYSHTTYADKTPIIGSFHRKTLQALMSKTPAWKSETLPPNFGNTLDDLTAHEKFIGAFKDRLRHQRDNFRVLLLKNIRVTSENVNDDPLPVPTMKELLGELARWFGPDSRTNDEIEADTDATARARFAYLRLETTQYCISNETEKKAGYANSQWDWIDPQLHRLRNKDRAYRRAFDSLILARDEYYFDGKKTIQDIKKDGFHLPTEDDVLEAVNYVASQRDR